MEVDVHKALGSFPRCAVVNSATPDESWSRLSVNALKSLPFDLRESPKAQAVNRHLSLKNWPIQTTS